MNATDQASGGTHRFTGEPHAQHNGHHGLLDAAKEFGSAGLRHLRARWGLAALESREAGRHVGLLAALGGGAVISLIVAYLFFAITVGFTIAWLCHAAGGVWVLVLLGTSLFHVVLGLMLAGAAKKQLSKPLFPATRAEIKKDLA
jgi:hypothetical protein